MLKKVITTLLILLSTFSILNSTAHAAGYKLPDSGQTKCYQAVSPYAEIPCAGTGQDGAYDINPMSYTDNGNGTITDNNTGLVWQKCSVGQNNDASCSGTAATYNWYQASGTYDVTYNAATQNVCGSLVLSGGGWRLPSKKELIGIVDYGITSSGATIQQSLFPNTISSYYWSSTTNAYNLDDVWYVFFLYGSVYYSYKNDVNYVRCVRGGN